MYAQNILKLSGNSLKLLKIFIFFNVISLKLHKWLITLINIFITQLKIELMYKNTL